MSGWSVRATAIAFALSFAMGCSDVDTGLVDGSTRYDGGVGIDAGDAGAAPDSGALDAGGREDASTSDSGADDAGGWDGGVDAGVSVDGGVSFPCNRGDVVHVAPLFSDSLYPVVAMSDDGRVVMTATFASLLPLDVDQDWDIYLLDRSAGVVSLISTWGGDAFFEQASADGRLLVVSDSGARARFFDRISGVERYVVPAPYDARGVRAPWYSADGSTLVWFSESAHEIPDRNGDEEDIYVLDVGSNRIERINVTAQGEQPTYGPSQYPRVSADGRYVIYVTQAGLLLGQMDLLAQYRQVLLHDRTTGTTTIVGTSTASLEGPVECDQASISHDGRHVAFRCGGANLLTGRVPASPVRLLYYKDMQTGRLEVINEATAIPADEYLADLPAISPDGRFVAFVSTRSDLSSEDPTCGHQLTTTYIYTVGEGLLDRVGCSKVDPPNVGLHYAPTSPRWSGDGRFLAYVTDGEHTPGTSDAFIDSFVYSFCPDGE